MIYLDCTTVLRQDFVSGIQRVLIDFATDNAEVRPVVWNYRKENFEILSKFPERQMLHRSPIKRIFIIVLLSPLVDIGTRLLHRFRRQIMRIELLRQYASRLYAAVHTQESFGNWRKLIVGEDLSYSNSDAFILVDIPTSKKYKKCLSHFLATREIRKIAYVHDLIPIDHPEFWSQQEYLRIREDFSEYLECIGHFNVIIANSLHTNRRFQEYFKALDSETLGKEKRSVKTVYPSSRLVEMKSSPSIKRHLTHREKNSFLMVGNFDLRKNFHVVLSAFCEVNGPAVLRIVSPSNLFLDAKTQSILNILKDKDAFEIQLFEHVSDRELALLYSKSSFLLIPSRAEGFGIPVIEGLAYNCHVIVANNSAMTELVEKFNLTSTTANSTIEWISLVKLAISGEMLPRGNYFEQELFTPAQFQKNFLSIVKTDLQDWG